MESSTVQGPFKARLLDTPQQCILLPGRSRQVIKSMMTRMSSTQALKKTL